MPIDKEKNPSRRPDAPTSDNVATGPAGTIGSSPTAGDLSSGAPSIRDASPIPTQVREATARLVGAAEPPIDTFKSAASGVRTLAQAGAQMAERAAEPVEQTAERLADEAGEAGEQTLDLGRELLEINQRTLQRTLDTMQALWGCRTLQDLMGVQVKYVTGMLEDGIERGARLSAAAMRQSSAAIGSLTRRDASH